MEFIQNFFSDSASWYLLSFLIFLFAAWKMGKTAFTKMLDDRIEIIKKEIETAETLRVEAQELLAQYQRKYRGALKDADTIVENAKKSAEDIKEKILEDIDRQIQRSNEQHKERLELMKRDAINDIKKQAAVLAVEATRKMISEQMDPSTRDALISHSIENIDKNIRN